MAGIPFVNDVDMRGNEVQNARVPRINGLPTATAEMNGYVVYNTQDDRYYMASASAWRAIPINIDSSLQGVTAAQLRDRTTHTGQQTADTISDFHAVVIASRLDEFAAPTAPVAFGSQKITGVAAGTATTDGINKGQLDAVEAIARASASGIAIKTPARAVAKTPITLSNTQTIDGVAIVAGDRVLVAGQADPIANGIYVAAAGAWARATDADGASELASGTLIAIREGTTEGDSLWGIVTDSASGAITPGTSPQNWGRALGSATGEIIVAGNGISKTGTTIAVVPKANSGITVDGAGVGTDASVSRNASGVVPNGSTTATITHNLGKKNIKIAFYERATGIQVYPSWTPVSTTAGTAEFKTAPTVNQYDWDGNS